MKHHSLANHCEEEQASSMRHQPGQVQISMAATEQWRMAEAPSTEKDGVRLCNVCWQTVISLARFAAGKFAYF